MRTFFNRIRYTKNIFFRNTRTEKHFSAGDTFGGVLSNINPLIGIGFNLLGVILSHFKKTSAAPQVLDAVQSAMNALEAHALDTMTKEQWESLRG